MTLEQMETELETRTKVLVAKYETITQELETYEAQFDADRPADYRTSLETQRALVIADAEGTNNVINAMGAAVRTICFLCDECGAYADNRDLQGMCDCDNGCGCKPFDMIIL